MANNWKINETIDLKRGIDGIKVWPHALLVTGDENAHEWNVSVLDDGKPAVLNGQIRAYFVRSDGATVTATGNIDGNIAKITMPEACYAYEGDLQAVMQLIESDVSVTISALLLRVRQISTDVIVDPGSEIPSLDDLLAQIEKLKQTMKDANSAIAGANSAKDAANEAASSANNAASAANKAKADADEATKNANDATTAANDAKDAANTAATNANTATDKANAATSNANSATENANEAAAAISNMTTSAHQVESDGIPTATVSMEDGHINIDFGIVKGDNGENGIDGKDGITPKLGVGTVNTGDPGTMAKVDISGSNENPELNFTIPRGQKGDQGKPYTIKGSAYQSLDALQNAIKNPEVGDQYNVGVDAPYNVYRWTGTAWEDQGKLQGPAGKDGAPGGTGPAGPQGVAGVSIGAITVTTDNTTSPNPTCVVTPGGIADGKQSFTLAFKGLKGATGAAGAQGPAGSQGATGPAGAAGPNTVSTSTTTNINGLIKGNGKTIQQATAGTDYTLPITYKTGEVATGDTWVDGKPIYRYVYSGVPTNPGGNEFVIDSNMNSSYVDKVISGVFVLQINSDPYFIVDSYGIGAAAPNWSVGALGVRGTKGLCVDIGVGFYGNGVHGLTVIVYFTKRTASDPPIAEGPSISLASIPNPAEAKADYIAMMAGIEIPDDAGTAAQSSPEGKDGPEFDGGETVHSKHYDDVNRYYAYDCWSVQMVQNAVGKWITKDECVKIIGEKYE